MNARTVSQGTRPHPAGGAPARVPLCLGEADPDRAWTLFLEECLPTLERALGRLVSDPEEARNLVVGVLERIRATWPETLRRFSEKDARASFRTWLSVVVRNHGIDALRSRHGRPTLPRAVERMDAERQELFRLLHWQRRTLAEAHAALAASGWAGSFEETAQAANEILSALPRATRVGLSSPRVPERGRGAAGADEEGADGAVADPAAPAECGPEQRQARASAHQALVEVLADLSGDERLLLRTYFLEGATARDVARFTGASSATRVYERVGALTERMRQELAARGFESEDLHVMMDFDWLAHVGPPDSDGGRP